MKKWRNKTTGEINEFMVHKRIEDSEDGNPVYAPFDGNIDEWEDYEEPETYYYISDCVNIESLTNDRGYNLPEEIWHKAIKRRKEIGNYFETREEAEKAVERLKAWKRLKDKGFRFILDEETEMPMFIYSGANGEKCITNAEESKQCRSDIDLLFGGEE